MNMGNTNDYEWVELPSKGRCYPVDSPLRKGKVAVAYLTAKDENIIMNHKAYTDGNIIDLIIKRKIVDMNIDPSTLVKGDRDAILIWLRRTGYGNEYPVTVRNSNGEGDTFTATIDLSEIKNREFLLPSDDKGYFSYFMKNGDVVKFKYLTGKETREIENSITGDEKDEEDNTFLTDTLKTITMSVKGNEDRNLVSQYIENMTTSDSFLYRSFIEDNMPGIDTVVNVEVPNEGVKTVLLQIDESILMNVE